MRLLPPVLLKGELGSSLAERMRHHHVEAVSVALIRDYKVVWEAAVGLADREEGKKATAETLFQAGSISKPVTAAALLREAQKGTFRLDVDVNEYLKSWKLPGNELTVRRKCNACTTAFERLRKTRYTSRAFARIRDKGGCSQ